MIKERDSEKWSDHLVSLDQLSGDKIKQGCAALNDGPVKKEVPLPISLKRDCFSPRHNNKDVLIENCVFSTCDDCIAIKAGRNNDGRRLAVRSENIVIRGCRGIAQRARERKTVVTEN